MELKTSLITEVIELARLAGEAVLRIYDGSSIAVERKADDSPLTEADMASHKIIVNGLRGLTPELPILSEESRHIEFSERRSWQRYWLVDPLDGTKEFINRNGEFTVNIALIDGHQSRWGVVRVPDQGETFEGGREMGSRWLRDGEDTRVIHCRQPPHEPLRVVGSRSHPSPLLRAYLEALGMAHELLPMGSSLKLCRVAAGDADLYPRLGLTSEWDIAAAQAVVEGAGGEVLKLDGEPLDYNTKAELLNPYFVVQGNRQRDWVTPARTVVAEQG